MSGVVQTSERSGLGQNTGFGPFLALSNEQSTTPEDGPIALANQVPFGSVAPVRLNQVNRDGYAVIEIAPYGRAAHRAGQIVRTQVFERADAEAMANEFNGRIASRVGLGAPFYIGHPDDPLFADRYKDTRAYGRIKKLEAGPNALLAHVKFNSAGLQLIRDEAFSGHSPRWFANETRRGEWHPYQLISAGFTNEPNLEVPALSASNEKQNQELKTKHQEQLNMNPIRDLLLMLGLIKPADPDTAYPGAIESLANEKRDLQAQVDVLTAERDTALSEMTALANERDQKMALANTLAAAQVDGLITSGRVIKDKRDAALAKITSAAADALPDATALSNEFGPATPIKTGATIPPGSAQQRQPGTDAEASARRIALANELDPKNFDRGWQLAKAKDPALFGVAA